MKHPFYPSAVVFTEMQKVAIVTGVLSFIAGAVLGWALAANRQSDVAGIVLSEEDEEALTATTTSLGTVSRGIRVVQGATDERIEVKDQQAGNSVYVAAVALAEPSWVAVREEIDGEPGRILGAQLFDVGEHSGEVELLRDTRPGARYHVYLLRDDGDLKFDIVDDAPITKDGLLILQPFKAL
jgi:hypothetical protein